MLLRVVVACALASVARAQAPVDICARTPRAVAAPDLHCIDLVPTPDLPAASGAVEMLRPSTPFGASVTSAGVHQWRLRITVAGLPDPRSLGNYTTYVAWLATPTMGSVTPLGRVGNGTFDVGAAALNSFIVLVSAERSAAATERRGRLVLRGMSPSALMRPHDFTALPPRAVDHHAHGAGDSAWTMPPMHPDVPSMIPGLENLQPRGQPFRPGRGIDVAALPPAAPRQVLTLRDGDSLALEATRVRRSIAGRSFVAYGFNGQWPGPLIRVDRAATIVVNFTNRIDLPTAVHWHGIRLDNRFDGVPHVTQDAVAPGASFRYVIHFPDAGIYWYHPHHREDIQQELGLYGNLLVQSEDPSFFGPAHRSEVLMLDDFLLDDAGAAMAFGREAPIHALMGRFGNVFLVNGEPAPTYRLDARPGDVIRLYLTNAANARPFNLSIPGARMKLVGGDVGKLLREQWVSSVVLAPAERWIVDVMLDSAGTYPIVNAVQAIDHARGVFFPEVDTLAVIRASGPADARDLRAVFATLRTNADVAADIDRYRAHFDRPADKSLTLTLRPGDLPFGLVQVMRLDTGFVNPVEWSATMPMMDWLATGTDVAWVLRDDATRRENMDIAWSFRRGDVLRLRLANDRHTLHPMQHPIHIHGQRFLVLAQNGIRSENLVWKDTFMLPVGSTAELLVEMSNPGRWMLHCHIAEHLEAGMHMVFTVQP